MLEGNFPIIVKLADDVWVNAANVVAVEDHTDLMLQVGVTSPHVTIIKFTGGTQTEIALPAITVVQEIQAQTARAFEILTTIDARVRGEDR